MTYEEIRYNIERGYYEICQDDIDLYDYIDDYQSKNLRHDIYSKRCMLSHMFTSDLYSYDKYYREKYHLKHHRSYLRLLSFQFLSFHEMLRQEYQCEYR